MGFKEFITEDDDANDVVDLRVGLTTNDVGEASFTTERLNGRLEAVILSGERPVDVEIMSELGYKVYGELQHVGTHYFPLTTASLSPNAHKRNFQAASFFLNERLIITVRGVAGVSVMIILRTRGEG